ncbi:hypothetical protein Hamer_G005510, partial [Homarus americanus]
MRSFIGVTGHFILDHTLNSVMLACRRFKGSHTSDNIYDKYQETVAFYDVRSKVTTIITDNAANMVKAYTLFPVEQLDEDEEDDEFDDNDCDILPPDDTTMLNAYTRTALVVKDGMEQDGQIKQFLAKVSNLVSFCRKSTVAAEVLSNEFKLQMATCTRWNSQLTMVSQYFEFHLKCGTKLTQPYKLKQYELNTIKELCDILEPFECVTNQIQGQNMVTSS